MIDESPYEADELESYYLGETLGKGVYSIVRKANHKLTDEPVAVKIYLKKAIEHAHRREMIQSEIEILKSLNHPSIIKYKDYYETDITIYIILELFEGLPLNRYIEDRCGETPRYESSPLQIWSKKMRDK